MPDSGRDNELTEEARFALGMAPLAREVMDRVRGMLPPGTHFGVFILAPVNERESQVVAITTDRQVVGHAVAQWYLNIRKG